LALAMAGLFISWFFIIFSIAFSIFIYLKYKFTIIEVIEDKLFIQEGIFFKTKKSIFLDKINNIDFDQNIIEIVYIIIYKIDSIFQAIL